MNAQPCAPLAPNAIPEEEIEHEQGGEQTQDGFEKPAEHELPAAAERASTAPLAREADCKGRGAARRQHATVAANRVSATSAGADGDLTARNAAGVGRSVAVREQVGHRSSLARSAETLAPRGDLK